MVRGLKKMIIGVIDWFLYRVLSTKQKQYISNIFTQKQKQLLKKVIKPGKKQAQLRRIERVKYRLYNLGFIERGLNELDNICKTSDGVFERKMAAWELATWYANKYTQEDAETFLKYLEIALENEKDDVLLRRGAILKAECYDLQGEVEEGKSIIRHALSSLKPHADLYLSAANLESDLTERMKWINKAFRLNGASEVQLNKQKNKYLYDSIKTNVGNQVTSTEGYNPKVSVIIPAYNASEFIHTSIDSMLNQTWTNVEILVVDDCSTDNTAEVVEHYAKKEKRVKFIKAKTNGGAYAARNLALQEATGDYITINDADDWSHAEKIETQVTHLMKNSQIMANFSQQVRATNDLKFYRRGKPGVFVFANMSSFMFRRHPVLDKLGYWDTVRFAGDSEFVKRVKKIFGEKSVVDLATAPLSFQRQSETSLTSHSAFGFPGYFMGVRKEYAEAHEYYHEMNPNNLYYDFPQQKRPFAVPEPMWSKREDKPSGRRHFDVIIASEFRLLGGTNMSNVEEIKAQKQMGLRTGLIQMYRYDLNSVEVTNPRVRELIDGEQVQMLVYGEKVSCDVLIVRHPPILQDKQIYLPDVKAKSVQVIVNQPPKRDYGENGDILYNINTCVENLNNYFGQKGIWYPIGPLVRESLYKHHQEELQSITLSKEDWVNIIDVKEWQRRTRPPRDSKIKIGRHSRDQYVKWPNNKEELLSIYPDRDPYEVHVLGGAKSPEKVLESLPSNWKVYEFGELAPKDFLATLDVFVYYTHPKWVEAFGRVIFEAMAAGVPVIIPPSYKELFGEAAIYSDSENVQKEINKLMDNEKYYLAQVAKSLAYVEKQFGYTKHRTRLEEFLRG